MTEPFDEADLIERSRRGDLDAFNALVLAHQDRVYNLCLRMLGSPQAAEDAAQETFISAYRHVERLRGPSLSSWLLRIASNACVDELRRLKRRPQVPLGAPDADDDAPAYEIADPVEGPEGLALRGEVCDALQRELLRLPPDQRLAIILSDVEGLSYEEVAASMSSSIGTVKSRISRGRARLREALRTQSELFGDQIRPTTKGRTAGEED
ncbi:MAG: sigma-70 family RNA polymerase sigma factor [Dehalococcoidia bacterium]